MYKKYWPFRSRSRAAAPRGRLEEESEDASFRGGVNKKKLRETPAAVTGEARASDAAARRDLQTQAERVRFSAPVPVRPRARDAARGPVVDLSVCVEKLDVDEEAEAAPSRRTSLETARSSESSDGHPRSPSSPPFEPAQPGVALQETPVFAAKAVMLKRERSGDGRPKRSSSLLSRSIGKDGRASPTIRREHSWCSSSRDASPRASPERAFSPTKPEAPRIGTR